MSNAYVKPGEQTTEYTESKRGSTWAAVATVLGILVSVASLATGVAGEGSTIGIIAGAVLALAGTFQQTFIRLGYIKSRTVVKAQASRTEAESYAAAVNANSTADAIMAASSLVAGVALGESDEQGVPLGNVPDLSDL